MNQAKTIIKWFFAKRVRAALFVATILIAGFLFFRSRSSTTDEPQIQTATVENGNIVAAISASGSVVTANMFEVTTKATGVVSEVYTKDGDTVTKGQKIAKIDLDSAGQAQNALAYASYVSATNSLSSAQNTYRSSQASLAVVYDEIKGHDSDETLKMKETRTKAEVTNDNAYNGIKSAEAGLANAALSFQQSSPTITAPQAGTISNLTIAKGLQTSSESTRVATVSREGKPIVSVNISEIDVPAIQIGQKATVTFDSIEGKTFTGNVVAIDKLGNSTSGVTSYPALIELDTAPEAILPNMAATANIVTASKTAVLVVPTSAINEVNGQQTVTVIKDGNQINTAVETGISSDTEIEIISGLTEGDEIVTGTVSLNQDVTFGSGGSFGSFGGGGGAVRIQR